MGQRWLCCCPCVVEDLSEDSNTRRRSSITKVATVRETTVRGGAKLIGPRPYPKHNTTRRTSPPSETPTRGDPFPTIEKAATTRQRGSRGSSSSTTTGASIDGQSTRRKGKSSSSVVKTVAGIEEAPLQQSKPRKSQQATYPGSSTVGSLPGQAASSGATKTDTAMTGHPHKASVGQGRDNTRTQKVMSSRNTVSNQRYVQNISVKEPSLRASKQTTAVHENPKEAIPVPMAVAKVAAAEEESPLRTKTGSGMGGKYTTPTAPAQQQYLSGHTATLQFPPQPAIPIRTSNAQDSQWLASISQSEIESDIHNDLTAFVDTMGLGGFFEDNSLRSICQKGAALARDPTSILNTREDIVDLTQLALYDTIIYCDNSNSMHQENGKRIAASVEVTKRVTELVSMIEPGGVRLRFMNFDKAMGLDNLRTVGDIDKAMKLNNFRGRHSDLGTRLERVVLGPLLYDQHWATGLKRPLLITTITDGAPVDEDLGEFARVVSKCKNFLEKNGYHPKSVVFQVSQVGNSELAEKFITGLHQDPEIRSMVYCTSERLDDKIAELRDNRRNLDRWILDLLSQGIRLQA